jgi:type IV secretion system protein TrbL
MLRQMLVLVSVLVCCVSVQAQKITAYGYPGDVTGDSNSSNGIGNHNNTLTALGSGGFSSAALTPEAANQYGVGLGQDFTVQAANGQTYNLQYDDTVPTGGPGQQPVGSVVVDIYDPNSVLTNGGNDNNFSTSLNGVPTVGSQAAVATGMTQVGTTATTGAGGVQDVSIAVVNPLLQKLQSAAQAWEVPLMAGVKWLFWILALISLCWTLFSLLLRGVDLIGIFAELFRFCFVTGFFYWLLLHGPAFAQDIIGSLRQLGGEASGTGQALVPAQIVYLGVAVLQSQTTSINWLIPFASAIPILLAVIILITTILIAANVVVLLVCGWVVCFAGVVVLGFGGCRWTSDVAINYFRTALGVGLSLMVLELIMGLGGSFLQSLVKQGQTGDIGELIALTIAVILIAVLSHRLPHMVAGMVTGSGHNGSIGAVGLMTAIGAAMAAAGIARTVAKGAGGIVGNGAVSSQQLLQERIAAAEAAMTTGSGRNGGNGRSQAGSSPSSRSGSTYSSATAAPGTSSSVLKVATPGSGPKASAGPAVTPSASEEPPLSAPMSPDDQWLAEHPEEREL